MTACISAAAALKNAACSGQRGDRITDVEPLRRRLHAGHNLARPVPVPGAVFERGEGAELFFVRLGPAHAQIVSGLPAQAVEHGVTLQAMAGVAPPCSWMQIASTTNCYANPVPYAMPAARLPHRSCIILASKRIKANDKAYEFASTYSYLSAMRIEELAGKAGVGIVWKPFLLGPIFKAQGWDTSPFNLYPAKGRYMVRDMGRIASARGLAFRMPEPFPQNGLPAARLALVGLEEGWGPAFVKGIYRAEFADGRDISDATVLAAGLEAAGASKESALARAQSPEIKARLRANTEEAQTRGIFGAPSFTTEDGELFWGDDRLEQALCNAASGLLTSLAT